MTPTQQLLDEIDAFATKHAFGLSIPKDTIVWYILNKHSEYVESNKPYTEWLNEWISKRGGSEEFRIPEDLALDFFRTNIN